MTASGRSWPRVSTPLVGRARAATSSRTSAVPCGRRARRPPSRSRRLSGTGRAPPASAFPAIRTSSRPSSRAKNGFPVDTSPTRRRTGRGSSSESRSRSRRARATSSRGPTRTRSTRPSGTTSRSENGALTPGASRMVASSPTGAARSLRTAIGRIAAVGASSHCRSSSAIRTGPRSASAWRTSSSAEADRPQVRRLVGPGVREEQRDLERMQPGRREAVAHLVERRRHEIGQPGEGEPGLSLDAPMRQHRAEAAPRVLDAELPQRGLPDPGRSRHRQSGGPGGGHPEKVANRLDLRIAPDHGTCRHG